MKLISTPPPDRTDLTIGCRITIPLYSGEPVNAIIVAFARNATADILVELQCNRPSQAPVGESSIKYISLEDKLAYCEDYIWERLWWVYTRQIISVIDPLNSILIDLSEEVRVESVMCRAKSEIKEIEDALVKFYKRHEEVFKESSWNCPKCNNNNAAGWKACDICYTPKPIK